MPRQAALGHAHACKSRKSKVLTCDSLQYTIQSKLWESVKNFGVLLKVALILRFAQIIPT